VIRRAFYGGGTTTLIADASAGAVNQREHKMQRRFAAPLGSNDLILLVAFLAWSGLAAAAAPPFPGAAPAYKQWVAAHVAGSPEGLTLDAQGRMYAAVSNTGEIVRVDGADKVVHIATMPSAELGTEGRTWGIAFGPDGMLYAAYVWHYSEAEEMDPLHQGCRNTKDQYSGVYRIDVSTGTVTPFLTRKDGWTVCFPDDVAVDAHGAVYVTDETLSGIWKIAADRTVTLWSAHPLLQWPADPFGGVPEGVNDLVIAPDGRSLYVVTDGSPMLLRIPIEANGTAGTPVVVAGYMSPLDGIALDENGNIFVSEILRNEIWLYSPDGARRVLVASSDTAPLVNPTSLVYRDGVLCTANLGWHVEPPPQTIVCISGFRRPSSSASAH